MTYEFRLMTIREIYRVSTQLNAAQRLSRVHQRHGCMDGEDGHLLLAAFESQVRYGTGSLELEWQIEKLVGALVGHRTLLPRRHSTIYLFFQEYEVIAVELNVDNGGD